MLRLEEIVETVKSTGHGAWGRVDLVGDLVTLRVQNVQQFDGTPRIYFGSNREQLVSGARRQSSTRMPYQLSMAYSYYITTNIVFDKPLGKDMYAKVVPIHQVSEAGLIIPTCIIPEGFVGQVGFTVLPVRSMQLDSMVRVAFLEFNSMVEEPVKVAKNSVSKKPATKKKSTNSKGGSNASDSHSEPTNAKVAGA